MLVNSQADSLSKTSNTVISIDAMGGDSGPSVVVGGMSKFAAQTPDVHYIVHGDEKQLTALIAKRKNLAGRCDIRHTEDIITMDVKPSHAVRHGKGSSMWSTVESVRNNEATVAVSLGNTGALMAVSMIRLRKLPGVHRPAIAILWPSSNPQGYNVMLDVGADIRADSDDLLKYALMGASYARNGLGLKRPRIGLLNVGTEEHKGRDELKVAFELISKAAENANYEFVGFVEGSDIGSDKVDVVVTDGFTGNIAIKTAEGTANQLSASLRAAFKHSLLSRFGALFALTSLRRMRQRMDPRRVNGGVFLGLNGTVVKSHGGADATGVSAAIKLAYEFAQSGFAQKLAMRVAMSDANLQSDSPKGSAVEEK